MNVCLIVIYGLFQVGHLIIFPAVGLSGWSEQAYQIWVLNHFCRQVYQLTRSLTGRINV